MSQNQKRLMALLADQPLKRSEVDALERFASEVIAKRSQGLPVSDEDEKTLDRSIERLKQSIRAIKERH